MYVTKLHRRNYVHGGVKVNDKQSIQSVINQLESSTDGIRNSMKAINNGEALTELTHALLLVDDSAKRCRVAISDLDETFESGLYTIEPFE